MVVVVAVAGREVAFHDGQSDHAKVVADSRTKHAAEPTRRASEVHHRVRRVGVGGGVPTAVPMLVVVFVVFAHGIAST